MDEVGFLTGIYFENGEVELLPVGGLSVKDFFTCSDFVTLKVHTKNGVILAKLTTNENQDIFKLNLNTSSKEETINLGVNYGTMVTFNTELKQISENRYTAKAYDDRYGLALGVEILEYFKDKELPFNLVVGGSVQEEVGLRGATTILSEVDIDLAIVLDCSRATGKEGLGELGKGVLIRYFDRAMVAFKELLELQVEACKTSNSSYQYFTTLGGTNAGAIHKHGKGILTLTHCVCGKDIHTHLTEFDSDDYQNAKKSLIEILNNLNEDSIKELRSKRH